jgi:hypothetical protein
MTRLATAALLALSVSMVSIAAQAQGACPNGAASGPCINPLLADAMRQTGVIFSQPKISYTHYPVLPTLDWKYRYPNSLIPDPQAPSAVGTPIGGGP